MKERHVRETTHAGTFYPVDAGELRSFVDLSLDEAGISKISGVPRIFVCPHAGYVYSGSTAAFSYKVLKNHIARTADYPRKVFLIGPSHQYRVEGLCVSDADVWNTPLGEVPVSPVAQKMIEDDGIFSSNNEAHLVEHSLEVQLPFLQRAYGRRRFEIIPILVSEVEEKEAVDELSLYVADDSIIIVSTDLSHYYPQEEAQERDQRTVDAILKVDEDALESVGDACGLAPLLIAVEFARKNSLTGELLKYRTSADTAGEKDAVVGYAAIYFHSQT